MARHVECELVRLYVTYGRISTGVWEYGVIGMGRGEEEAEDVGIYVYMHSWGK